MHLIFVVSVAILASGVMGIQELYGGCFEDRKVGLCKAAFPRYYFDFNSKKCEFFIYGGCDGTGNNFLTMEECEEKCAGIRKNELADPVDGI
uniref:Putative salivary kunitz domain protein n=1 Tax=Ixodes ricinus TaxID=34613 RepID=A0A147BFJ6_IXORI